MDNVASPKSDEPARSGTRYLWRAHAALLALVGGYTASCAFIFTTPDANIGLGLGLSALGAMGAPWTLPIFWDEQLTFDSGLFVVGSTGGAMLNLVLHAVVSRWWIARASHRR